MSPTTKASPGEPGEVKKKIPAAKPEPRPAHRDWVSPVIGGASLLLTGLALILHRSSRDASVFARNPFPADRHGWAIYFFRGKRGKLGNK